MSDLSSPCFTIKVLREGSQKGVRVGVDVPANITDFTFEDADRTSKLTFTLDNFDLAHFDAPILKQGDLLEFSFGYVDDMSPARQAVVTKITGGIKLKVEALGKDYLLNKVLKTRNFEHMKRSDVARKIAQENGYGQAEIDVDDTVYVLNQITQARMTDLGFLRDMARREGFEVYMDATGFHFHPKRLGAKPQVTFTYYTVKPEEKHVGMLLAFPTIEIDVTAKPGAVVAKGRDPLKKEDINARGDNDSTKGRDVLAPVLEVVDEQTGATSLEARRATEATVATTATSKEDAQRQANGAYQNAQMAAVKFKVPAVGNPHVMAKSICKFDGLGKRLNGPYYMATVTHKIGATYTMDLDARRNGTNAGGSGSAKPASSSGKTNDQPAGGGDGLKPYEVVDEQNGVTRVEYR